MSFNPLEFALFLPLVFLPYWFGFNRSLKFQHLLVSYRNFVFHSDASLIKRVQLDYSKTINPYKL